ncbi:MAG: YeeE/YedE family protein [Proteobacteria bacterium]|nr:YeeE/YedE family protein [Pseudomonadota bacterium]
MNIIDLLQSPWPWWVTGPLIGMVVPVLLLIGNRTFGISSTFRHVWAATAPCGLAYFTYDWRAESWNLVFVAGIALGGYVAMAWLTPAGAVTHMSGAFAGELARAGIDPHQKILPRELFSWHGLATLPTLAVTVLGGLLVGFGARYAGGCTGGHSIAGIASFQRASLVATLAFMAGGFIVANALVPLLLEHVR